MIEALYSFLGLGGLAAAIWLAIQLQKIGAADIKVKHAEKEKNDALQAAQSALNRTRTRSDRIKRLRDWRDKLR
jgi:shikimate 5-dehydrogenase